MASRSGQGPPSLAGAGAGRGVWIAAVLVAALLTALLLVLAVSRVERAPDEPRTEPAAPPTLSDAPDGAQADRAIAPLDDAPARGAEEPPPRADAAEPSAGGVTLAGRVVDVHGRAIAGAELFRLGQKSSSLRGDRVATSDEEGSFRIVGLAPGRWSLRIASAEHPDGFERGAANRPGAIVDELVFVLADGAEVRGRVVGAPDSVLESLWVRTVHVGWSVTPAEEPPLAPGPRWTRCAADGSFVVRGVESGSFVRLGAHDDEGESYQRPLTSSVEVRAGSEDVVLVYQPPTMLVAEVVDARTGLPVTAFEVMIGGKGFVTPLLGADGRAQHEFPEGRVRTELHLPEACSMLRIDAHGYAPQTVDVDPLERRELHLGTLRLEPAPVHHVRVLDGGSGAPVPRALVTLWDRDEGRPDSPWREQRTDEQGRARLNGLPGKYAVLRVLHDDYEPYERELSEQPQGFDGIDLQEVVSLARRPSAR